MTLYHLTLTGPMGHLVTFCYQCRVPRQELRWMVRREGGGEEERREEVDWRET